MVGGGGGGRADSRDNLWTFFFRAATFQDFFVEVLRNFWHYFQNFLSLCGRDSREGGGGCESTLPRLWDGVKRPAFLGLKHKDSFGKSENLSKIFFTEILVFDHDYEGKSSSSNGLLWISFIFLKIIYLNYFSNCSEGLRTNLYTLSTILCKV